MTTPDSTTTKDLDALAASSVHELAAGNLTGPIGHAVARLMREPGLRLATRLYGECAGAPLEDFYQGDNEAGADWSARRKAAIDEYCTPCPVRAACAELAFREKNTHGVHGGLTEEALTVLVKVQHLRLEAARDADKAAIHGRQRRMDTAAEVLKLALRISKYPQQQAEAVRAAAQRRDALRADHRARTGWTTAA
ncbi:MAG: hypothetical protein HOV68_05235 [Streptomycetaceae bacterium]|nr:hypothetical protein [Streptomycetaceae bacterium]